MFRFVVLSALVACAFAFPRQSRVPLFPDGRIIGGESVSIVDYPYQISLLWYGSHICGGSIISTNYVVTAAHCTDGSSTADLTVRTNTSFHNTAGNDYSINLIAQDNRYDSETIDYDISVLRLSSHVSYGQGVAAIALPELNENVEAGTLAVVSGWGTTSEGGSAASQLQAVEVPIVGLVQCRYAYGGDSVTERMICAGSTEGGKDACQGDSGGPLVANGKLVGIVSWGYGCARPEYPGVYASVPNLRDFIGAASGI